jgi:hypothetical protein
MSSMTPNEKAEFRRTRYKNTVDAEDGRRRREDQIVGIRKASRDAQLEKKRRGGLPASTAAAGAPQMGHSSALQQKVCSARLLSIWSVCHRGSGGGFSI